MSTDRESPVNKQAILIKIIEQLSSDLLILEQAVKLARDTATHADCLGSSKYETMGLEASYLAQGQGIRLLEIERSLEHFKNITLDGSASVVKLSTMLELEDEQGMQQLLWLASEAGGLKVECAGAEVTVITPRSPLGRALLFKCCGDSFDINIAGKTVNYEILTLF